MSSTGFIWLCCFRTGYKGWAGNTLCVGDCCQGTPPTSDQLLEQSRLPQHNTRLPADRFWKLKRYCRVSLRFVSRPLWAFCCVWYNQYKGLWVCYCHMTISSVTRWKYNLPALLAPSTSWMQSFFQDICSCVCCWWGRAIATPGNLSGHGCGPATPPIIWFK